MNIDFTSAAWLHVAEWAQSRVDVLRAKNDGQLSPEATAALRGEIAAYKSLLALPKQAAARAFVAEPD